MSGTQFEFKCSILSEIWIDYRDDEEFLDFIEYNDLGLPLAYALDNGIVEASTMAEDFVIESFRLLLVGLDIEGDPGFERLDDVLTLGASIRDLEDEEDEDEPEEGAFPPEVFRDKSNGE